MRAAGNSGVVAFWLAAQTVETPGRAYAQTTRFEPAEVEKQALVRNAKLAVGIEEGFGNARIRRRFAQDALNVAIVDTLEDMVQNAVSLVRQ